MEVICSSERSADFQRTTRCYILQSRLWEPQILSNDFKLRILISLLHREVFPGTMCVAARPPPPETNDSLLATILPQWLCKVSIINRSAPTCSISHPTLSQRELLALQTSPITGPNNTSSYQWPPRALICWESFLDEMPWAPRLEGCVFGSRCGKTGPNWQSSWILSIAPAKYWDRTWSLPSTSLTIQNTQFT
jgi:hypothetical protein